MFERDTLDKEIVKLPNGLYQLMGDEVGDGKRPNLFGSGMTNRFVYLAYIRNWHIETIRVDCDIGHGQIPSPEPDRDLIPEVLALKAIDSWADELILET